MSDLLSSGFTGMRKEILARGKTSSCCSSTQTTWWTRKILQCTLTLLSSCTCLLSSFMLLDRYYFWLKQILGCCKDSKGRGAICRKISRFSFTATGLHRAPQIAASLLMRELGVSWKTADPWLTIATAIDVFQPMTCHQYFQKNQNSCLRTTTYHLKQIL